MNARCVSVTVQRCLAALCPAATTFRPSRTIAHVNASHSNAVAHHSEDAAERPVGTRTNIALHAATWPTRRLGESTSREMAGVESGTCGFIANATLTAP